MKKSIIISYKDSNDDRKENIKYVLNYLSMLTNNETEIILVEQGSESKIDWLNDIKNNQFINHIFIKNDGIFNKGWGYNIGVKESSGDYIMFHDSDMFLKINSYKNSFNCLQQFDVINPYSKIFYLNKENTKKFVSNFILNTTNSSVNSYVISGGIFFMTKNKYMQIKGFDESCYGYGHEDDIFDIKLKKLGLNIKNIDDSAIHIYHEVNDKIDDYYSRKDINKLIFNDYNEMTKEELLDKIKSTLYFGEKNINTNNNDTLIYKNCIETITNDIINNISHDTIDKVIKESMSNYMDILVDTFILKMKEHINNEVFNDKNKKKIIRKIINKNNGTR